MDSINRQNSRALDNYISNKQRAVLPKSMQAQPFPTQFKSYAKDGNLQKIIQQHNAITKIQTYSQGITSGINAQLAIKATKTDSLLCTSALATAAGAYSQFYKYRSAKQGLKAAQASVENLQKELQQTQEDLKQENTNLEDALMAQAPARPTEPSILLRAITEKQKNIASLEAKMQWLTNKLEVAQQKESAAAQRMQQTELAASAVAFKSTNVLIKLAIRANSVFAEYGAKTAARSTITAATVIGLPLAVQGIYRELNNLHQQQDRTHLASNFKSESTEKSLQEIAKQIQRNQPRAEAWMSLGINGCKTIRSLIGLAGLTGVSSFVGIQLGLDGSELPTLLEPVNWLLAATAAGLGSVGLTWYKSYRSTVQQSTVDYWLSALIEAAQTPSSGWGTHLAYQEQMNAIAAKHGIARFTTLSSSDKMELELLVADKAHRKLLKNDPMYAACFLLDSLHSGEAAIESFLKEFNFSPSEWHLISHAQSDQQFTEAARIIMQRLGLV